jgi:thiol:disulfide interchange protein DsbC
MADYNKQGITVRYLAFPRGGLKSSAYHTMVSVWCADDPKLAMDNAKKGLEIAPGTCENSVKEQYELGLFFGVNGTPAMVFEDGSLKPGYVPADRLIQMLQEK